MPIVIPSGPPATEMESWILDGLAINDGVTLSLESISDPPAPKLPEWVKGADSDGALLGRPPTHDVKVIEMRVRVSKQATMDAATAHIGSVLDKLQECEQNANGLPLVWDPATSTHPALTIRCLLGEITDLPKDWQDSGWFVFSPALTIRLTCSPFFEGAEYLAGSVTNTDPIQTLELSGVKGDVPALGRLVVTDAASQSRRYVAWGLESRWYPTSAPPSLIVDSTVMTTTGFAGVTATRSGAYSGATNNVISATLRTQTQAICGLGNLTHIGSFRPHLRFYASATTMAVRLTFQALDGPMRSLSYRVPVVVGWNFIDLGLVSIPQAALGTQKWTGRLEAYSTATGGETFQADVVLLIPAEAYGRARATFSTMAGTMVGHDEFTTMTAGAALDGRVAPAGGVWTTSGAVTDFVAADGPATGDETLSRATTVDGGLGRTALLGSTSYTAIDVSLDFIGTAGLLPRAVDDSNFLQVRVAAGGFVSVRPVAALIAGDVLAQGYIPVRAGAWRRIRAVVYASGNGFVVVTERDSGAVLLLLAFSSTALATGGTLASGKPGFLDRGDTGTGTRYFDNFYAALPGSEPIVVHTSQSIEFRHDTTLREDAAGTHTGPPAEYVGSRFYVPNAGGPGRKSRVAVVARRNDVATMFDDNIADSTTVEVRVTPRYLAVPRA